MNYAISRARVLFVAPSFGPSGGEIHALECITRWHIRGVFKEIGIVTTKRGIIALKNRGLHDVKAYVMPLIPLNEPYFFARDPLSALFASIIKTVLCIALILNIMKVNVKSNLVIATSHFVSDLLPAVVYSKLTKARLIVYIHHLHPPIFIRSKYHPIALSLFARINDFLSVQMIKYFADKVITLPSVKRQAMDRGISEYKVRVTGNGINLKCIERAPKGKYDYDACFLGRTVPLKGIYDLIIIWKYVCSKIPNVKLVIIGESPPEYGRMLSKRIETNSLSANVVLKGYLPEKNKYAVLKASKIFTFPSYEEGWGISVCEAMACGLPVVAYDLPAYDLFKDVIFKAPRGDKRAFSEMVWKLLLDEKLRKEASEKAKEIANQFDWDTLAEEELTLLGS